MSDHARRAAREATSSPAFRIAARAGHAANGVLHLVLGAIIIAVAFGNGGESSQSGAFKALAGAPLGVLALWVLATGLWALGAWDLLAGLLERSRGGDAKAAARTWRRRLSNWGRAVVYIVLGGIAAAVALGARPNSEQSSEQASRGVLSLPGGPWLLGAVGLGIGIAGVVFVVIGVRRGFCKKMTLPSGATGRAIAGLGAVGYVAKGLSLVTVGLLVLTASVQVDADAAGGLDGAIQTLIGLPYGPVIAVVVGVGFIAYGVFSVVRAKYARLDS